MWVLGINQSVSAQVLVAAEPSLQLQIDECLRWQTSGKKWTQMFLRVRGINVLGKSYDEGRIRSLNQEQESIS